MALELIKVRKKVATQNFLKLVRLIEILFINNINIKLGKNTI